MMLIKNKRTGQEYTVTPEEWADMVANKMQTKYNILQKDAAQSKDTTTIVNVIKFKKKEAGIEETEPKTETDKPVDKFPKKRKSLH